VILASEAEDPGQGPGELILVLYAGPRWSFWRPPLLSEPGVSFVLRPMRSSGLLFLILRHYIALVVGHRILGFIARGCSVSHSEDSFISMRGLSGGSVTRNTSPSSSDDIPMASKRFALQVTARHLN
jgi:hypothetical protein